MISPITTHVADAQAQLTSAYSQKPTAVALVGIMTGGYQVLEDGLGAADKARLLFGRMAYGQQLDDLGAIVGAERNGVDDDTMYALVLGSIARNNSDGTIEAILNVAKLIWQCDAVYADGPNAPGHARVRAYAYLHVGLGSPKAALQQYPLLLRILKDSIGGGLQLGSITTFDAAQALACDGPQVWVAGLADAHGSGGGLLADLFYADPTN
ncbi:MAG: hypothetical protein EOO40_00835 [Deltaproteobacteria bacterium]|nr:MAG: hypothetical protein EOO40_00835 [Deltaproteobacteria bacterium]